MALNQFIQFMKNDLEGSSSTMCNFLCKRAKLMISYSIDLLGDYLKVLREEGAEEGVDINQFLDDISQNLEEFKMNEKSIRERNFLTAEDSVHIDQRLVSNDIFSVSQLSQLHAVGSGHSDTQNILEPQRFLSGLQEREPDRHF